MVGGTPAPHPTDPANRGPLQYPEVPGPLPAPYCRRQNQGAGRWHPARRPLSPRNKPCDNEGPAPLSRKSSVPKTAPRGPSGQPAAGKVRPRAGSLVHLDLTCVPSGSRALLLDEELFPRVCALGSVVSGHEPREEEGMRGRPGRLLAPKQRWDPDLQVTRFYFNIIVLGIIEPMA